MATYKLLKSYLSDQMIGESLYDMSDPDQSTWVEHLIKETEENHHPLMRLDVITLEWTHATTIKPKNPSTLEEVLGG